MKLKFALLALIGIVAGVNARPADTVALTEATVRVTVAKRLTSILIEYGEDGKITRIHRNYVTRTTIASDPPTVTNKDSSEVCDPKELALLVESKEQADLLDFLTATDKAASAFTAICRDSSLTTKPDGK